MIPAATNQTRVVHVEGPWPRCAPRARYKKPRSGAKPAGRPLPVSNPRPAVPMSRSNLKPKPYRTERGANLSANRVLIGMAPTVGLIKGSGSELDAKTTPQGVVSASAIHTPILILGSRTY